MPIDLPGGKWTPLLLADQWPSSSSLESVFNGANARQKLASEFERFADLLSAINANSVAPQRGLTAEDIRSTLTSNEARARDVANANLTKSTAYAATHRHVSELRSALRELASEGNDRIEAVNSTSAPIGEKVAQIVAIITEIRGRVFAKVAGCAGEIYSEIQKVLDVQGIDTPPRTFAASKGVDSLAKSQIDPARLNEDVSNELAGQGDLGASVSAGAPSTKSSDEATDLGVGSPSGLAGGGAQVAESNSGLSGGGAVAPAPAPAPAESATTPVNNQVLEGGGITSPALAEGNPVSGGNQGLATGAATAGVSPTNPRVDQGLNAGASANSAGPRSPVVAVDTGQGLAGGALTTPAAPNTSTNSLPSADIKVAPSLSTQLPNSPTATPSIEAPSATTAPPVGNSVGAPQAPTAPTPTDLAQSFNAGNQTGTPMSASAEAISTAATSSVHSAPPPLISPVTDASTPAGPVFESAHAATAAPTTEVPQMAQAPTEFTQTVVASPTAAPVSPTVAAPSPISAGPLSIPSAAPTPPSGLLAYGADLRPAATSIPTPPAMPAAAAPGSAPVNPASGSSPTGQPAVVRQQASNPAAQVAASAGLAERAFAATATGATVGAGAARAVAKERLQQLLEAVARKQPELNWVIGDLEDGTTVLVTDLAGGWIPPGIEIPTGVKLLPPATRSGDLEMMLGPTRMTAAYRPGQYLPPAKDAEPVRMSIRARDTDSVDDLGWELSQATKWRDGLPRLAHTLAKAVSAQTGCLDSEVELLRDYLASIARLVMDKYPDSVNPAQVGNWQLLATIDALINDEKTLANYHFAWFQAQVLTREGHA